MDSKTEVGKPGRDRVNAVSPMNSGTGPKSGMLPKSKSVRPYKKIGLIAKDVAKELGK